MPEHGYEVSGVYSDLRDQVLGLGAQGDSQSPVIAVLMETGYPEAVATLVAISDGTVSLYFSNGGGVIGAGEHDAVRGIADAFLASAADYVSHGLPATSCPLPAQGHVRIYIVTPQGTVTAEAREDDLGYNRHAWSPLFHHGHELIGAIREYAPQ